MNITEIEALYTNHPYRWEMTLGAYDEGEPCYVVRYPDLPGCMAQGDTPEEALQSLIELREPYIESMRRRGLPVPDPQKPANAPRSRAAPAIESGKLLVPRPGHFTRLQKDVGEA